MKTMLIIYPHWPPSNLVGTLRPRFTANYLSDFGWQPIVLTVKPDYYEEVGDENLIKTVDNNVIVEKVDAKPVTKPRIIGDIGLRAFGNIKRKALEIISNEKIDFIWISIPSFYTAVLGRLLHRKAKIPYGIDYQDPWVRSIKNNVNLRSVLSLASAYLLEPFAVKKASLITGITKEYYKGVLQRNFKNKNIAHAHMPVGFDPNDYKVTIEHTPTLWDDMPDCKALVYAGAFLPNSVYFIDLLFSQIYMLRKEEKLDPKIQLFFVGTQSREKSIKYYAKKHNIENMVHEYVERIPYLEIIQLLKKAFGVLIIGSTEKHYSASKTFQALLSKRPVFTIFHTESSAVKIMRECRADQYTVRYNPHKPENELTENIKSSFFVFTEQNQVWLPELSPLKQYSAKENTRVLVDAINEVI